MRCEVLSGDCVERMREMPEGSVDAVVTDPPYGLEFMGKDWDRLSGQPGYVERGRITDRPDAQVPYGRGGGVNSYQAGRPMQAWHEAWAREALRVLKPGGHLLAFGGTRTYHRLVCAVEDAGFEIRDTIAWQHVEGVFCACDSPMRGVRNAVSDGSEAAATGGGSDVLAGVQRETAGSRVGETRAQGTGGVDDSEQRELRGEDERSAESGVEGRGDAAPSARQLRERSVRASTGVGAADGSEGSLRDGAPARGGADGRASAESGGVRASSGSRSAEQCADEPRAMAVEWISQGGGVWPGCPRCGKPLAPPFFGGPLIWEYGSGFPKSLDVSKAIDKVAGAEQTSEAQEWEGWGTALKPAHEPIVVARKPLVGTVAGNVLAHGTGAINVDGCRVGFAGAADEQESKGKNRHGDFDSAPRNDGTGGIYGADLRVGSERGNYDPPGRWPANVVLSHHEDCVCVGGREVSGSGHFPSSRGASMFGRNGHDGLTERHLRGEVVEVWACVPGCPVRQLDDQTGELVSGRLDRSAIKAPNQIYGARPRRLSGVYEQDRGGASRFFYCAKSSRAERGAGLDGERNPHPTVKPIGLMRWLVRLVTPPGGLVLDPFAGSGTTGCAAALEGVEFVGIEREVEYVRIAEARIAFWREHPDGLEAPRRRREDAAGQLGLL